MTSCRRLLGSGRFSASARLIRRIGSRGSRNSKADRPRSWSADCRRSAQAALLTSTKRPSTSRNAWGANPCTNPTWKCPRSRTSSRPSRASSVTSRKTIAPPSGPPWESGTGMSSNSISRSMPSLRTPITRNARSGLPCLARSPHAGTSPRDDGATSLVTGRPSSSLHDQPSRVSTAGLVHAIRASGSRTRRPWLNDIAAFSSFWLCQSLKLCTSGLPGRGSQVEGPCRGTTRTVTRCRTDRSRLYPQRPSEDPQVRVCGCR